MSYEIAHRYAKARAELDAIREELKQEVEGYNDQELNDVAEIIGWKRETLDRLIKPPQEKTPTLSSRQRILALVPDKWTKASELYSTISDQLGYTEGSVRKVLKLMHANGEVEAKGHKNTYMGKSGYQQTHYRQLFKLSL